MFRRFVKWMLQDLLCELRFIQNQNAKIIMYLRDSESKVISEQAAKLNRAAEGLQKATDKVGQ